MAAGLGWVGAAIALATTIASGIISSNQAKKQRKANQEAAAAQQEMSLAENQASLIELEKMKLLMSQQEAERQAVKEKERKIIKYGAIAATGFILYKMLNDD